MFFYRGRKPGNTSNYSMRCRAAAICSLLLAAASSPMAQAAPPIPLTLAEAEDLALKDEPGLLQLQASANAFSEQSLAAGQLPDPSMRIGLANYPISGGGFSAEGMTQAQLGYRQTFPRERLRDKSSERYRALATVEEYGADARARAVIQATRSAWLKAWHWQSAERVLQESRPLFADLLQVTRSLYAVGRAEQGDVLGAELELRRLDDRLIEAGRSRATAQGAMSEWLGSDAWRPAADKLPDWEHLPPLPDLQSGLDAHPLLRAASARIDADAASIDIAEEKGKPGWALDLGYGYREGFQPNGEPRSDFISLAVTVELPIFRKNRQDRDLAAALHARSAAVAGKARMDADLRSQLRVTYANWIDLSRRLALYESDILDLARQRAEAAMVSFKSDTGDFADVMLGQIAVVNTELDYLRLQTERAEAYAKLANLGGVQR